MLDLGKLRIGVVVDDATAIKQIRALGTETSNAESKAEGFKNVWGKLKGAIAAAGLGIAVKNFTSSIVDAYAEFQQLEGGVKKLFGNSSKEIMKNAQQAYKTAGISANKYMEQATSFSAALIQSLNGDTRKAAKITDMAIKDMSDNANTFGTDMQSIQNAYQGFAKQNYTMLDNLKLGYGGTKQEMERLLRDAEKISGVKYDINNLSDVYEAIHIIQEETGITGTTAKEAAKTVDGAVNSMKAAWENWLTAIGSGDNVEQSTQEMMDAVKNVVKNVAPVIADIAKSMFDGVATAIGDELKKAGDAIKNFVNKHKTTFQLLAVAVGALIAALVAFNGATILAAAGSALETAAIGGLIAAETVATAATTAFGAAVAFLTSPITLVIAAIAAAIAIIILLVKNWDKVKNALKKGLNFVINSKPVQKAIDIVNKLKTVWNKVKSFIKKAVAFALKTSAIGSAISLINKLKNAWDKIKSAAKKAASFAVKIPGVKTAIDAFSKLKSWWDKIKGKHTASFTTKTSGKGKGHRIGIREVPYDNYQALLHKGETVLTAPQKNQLDALINKSIMSGSRSGNTYTVNFNGNYNFRDRKDIDYFMSEAEKLTRRRLGVC